MAEWISQMLLFTNWTILAIKGEKELYIYRELQKGYRYLPTCFKMAHRNGKIQKIHFNIKMKGNYNEIYLFVVRYFVFSKFPSSFALAYLSLNLLTIKMRWSSSCSMTTWSSAKRFRTGWHLNPFTFLSNDSKY